MDRREEDEDEAKRAGAGGEPESPGLPEPGGPGEPAGPRESRESPAPAARKDDEPAASGQAEPAASPRAPAKVVKGVAARQNNVRKLRTERMMSKAELARRAGLSTLTVDRIERGMSCRMDTKRKVLEALGLRPQDRLIVFGEDD